MKSTIDLCSNSEIDVCTKDLMGLSTRKPAMMFQKASWSSTDSNICLHEEEWPFVGEESDMALSYALWDAGLPNCIGGGAGLGLVLHKRLLATSKG